MSDVQRGYLSALILDTRNNVQGARDRLFEAVLDEMRRMAGNLMKHERPGCLLQPSALVSEAVIRLINGGALDWADDRRHLFAAVALAMRRTLVDYARKAPPGFQVELALDEIPASSTARNVDLLALDDALDELAGIDERRGLVVVLKHFGGMTIAQIAYTLDVCPATVEGDWRYARAWLYDKLKGDVA